MPVPHPLEGLKPARLRANLSASLCADRIGVTVQSYYRFEKGERRLYFDKACILADMIGVSLDELRKAPGTLDTAVAVAGLEDWNV